jgi:hypothetical protein
MRRFITVFVLFNSVLSFAQIETDRPNFTASPNVVPKGALQIETGFVWENDKQSLAGIVSAPKGSVITFRNLTVNTTLLRFGLTDNIELRFNTSFNNNREIFSDGFSSQDNVTKSKGFSTSFIGFKTNLYKNDKLSIGFLGHLYIPELTSGDFTRENSLLNVAPEFLIPLTYEITDRFGVALQYGLTWDGATANPTFTYTLALGYSITDKLSFYLEPYGFIIDKGEEIHSINGGFTYLINNNFQVDLTGGLGLNESAPDNFVNCGASFLLFNH